MAYTVEEFESAKEFLRERLRNERSMSADVLRLLEVYAAYLLTSLFNGATDDDIELLIATLIDELLADCQTLAVDEHDNGDAVVVWLLGERFGDTLRGRVEKRVRTFYDEVAAVYVAGRLLGRNYDDLLAGVVANLKTPWKNEVLVEVREKIRLGELSAVRSFDEPHFGMGNPTSSLVALDRLLVYAVADAWMFWQYEDAKSRGAKGYFVVRGSSYPCEECESHTGVFFPIGDEENRPQYHAHCCCVVVYSYVEHI